MRMFSYAAVYLLIVISLAGLSVLSASGSARAFDGASSTDNSKAPLQMFKNPQAALRAGLEGVRSGDSHSAVEALKYAAAGGESLAQWKLGKMYADGDGVPHDDVKAYEYFSQIVQSYDEDNPNRRAQAVISSAFVAVGVYSLNGIANTKIQPDPERALEMFQYAATNFGDANAQYNLARMYLDGAGVKKDGRQAARWLNLAADKGHCQAQALLGHILFAGHDGVQRQRARGLMWLTMARKALVDPKKDQWIVDLYDKAVATANDGDRQVAQIYLDDYLKKRN
jgi:TPR repeat protein